MDTQRHRLFPGITAVVALALLASACGSNETDPSAAPSDSEPSGETTTTEFDDSEVELTNEAPEPEDDASTTVAPAPEAEPDDARDAPDNGEELFPDVLDATATLDEDGTWTVSATLSSPYDSPERYADAWRVVGPDGTEYGVRVLTHDHASEQPFTRSHGGISIPDDVTTVTIEGRDQVSGWGGASFELELAR